MRAGRMKFKNPEAFRTFGYRWAGNKKFLDAIQGDQVLHIDYEEWIKNPDMVANSIEKIFGVRVAREEIERKINIHDLDPNGSSCSAAEGGLVPPSPGVCLLKLTNGCSRGSDAFTRKDSPEAVASWLTACTPYYKARAGKSSVWIYGFSIATSSLRLSGASSLPATPCDTECR